MNGYAFLLILAVLLFAYKAKIEPYKSIPDPTTVSSKLPSDARTLASSASVAKPVVVKPALHGLSGLSGLDAQSGLLALSLLLAAAASWFFSHAFVASQSIDPNQHPSQRSFVGIAAFHRPPPFLA